MGELSWIALHGRDYTELGPLAALSLPGAGTVALSRGAFSKWYAHVDPNEDGALVARAERGVLIAVVDGRNGVRASEVALGAVRDRAAALLTPDVAAFGSHAAALVRGVASELEGERRSRTCLLVAALHPEICTWCSFGDCALIRATEPGQVNSENPLVLGPRLWLEAVPRESWLGRFERRPGERIAAVTDGVVNFLADRDEAQRLLADAPDDATAATALARTAMESGAGDNVGVAASSA